MGWIKHDAIIVTSCDEEGLNSIREKAISLGLTVSEIVRSPINGYASFLVAPDGSKEGWEDSDIGNERRKAFIAWLREGESRWSDWIAVEYGETPCKVTDGNGTD